LNRKIVRIGRLVGGAVLVVIGMIGGLIPVLQGWVFVLAGLTLMAPESRRARAALDWAKRKVGASGDTKETEDKENKKDEDNNDENA